MRTNNKNLYIMSGGFKIIYHTLIKGILNKNFFSFALSLDVNSPKSLGTVER